MRGQYVQITKIRYLCFDLVHSWYTRMAGFGRREIELMQALCIYDIYIEYYSVALYYQIHSKSHAWDLLFYTVCPRSLDPFHKVSYYIKWVKTSWTYCVNTVDIFTWATNMNITTITLKFIRLIEK